MIIMTLSQPLKEKKIDGYTIRLWNMSSEHKTKYGTLYQVSVKNTEIVGNTTTRKAAIRMFNHIDHEFIQNLKSIHEIEKSVKEAINLMKYRLQAKGN